MDEEDNTFKFCLKVQVSVEGKGKVDRDVCAGVCKCFQEDLPILQRHLEGYKLQFVHVKSASFIPTEDPQNIELGLTAYTDEEFNCLKDACDTGVLGEFLTNYCESKGAHISAGLSLKDKMHLAIEMPKKLYFQGCLALLESSHSSGRNPQEAIASTDKGYTRRNVEVLHRFNETALSVTVHSEKVLELDKHFIIHVPEHEDKNISSVKIESSNCKVLDGTKMKRVSGSAGLWETRLNISVGENGAPERIRYNYVVKTSIPILLGFIKIDEVPAYSGLKHMNAEKVQRDLWNGFEGGGVYAHCDHILKTSDLPTANVRDLIMQVEKLSFLDRLKLEFMANAIQGLTKCFRQENRKALAVFGVMIGRMLRHVEYLSRRSILTAAQAKSILDGVLSLSAEDFPKSSVEYLPGLTLELFYIADQEGYCFLKWMEEMYDYFPIEVFHKELMLEMKNSRSEIVKGSDDPAVASASRVCSSLYVSTVEGKSDAHQIVLENLFRLFPDFVRIKTYQILMQRYNVPGKEPEIWKTLHGCIEASLKASLSKAKGRWDFNAISSLWKSIQGMQEFEYMFRNQIEKDILYMLDHLQEREESSACKVIKDLLQHNLFIEKGQQTLLMECLSQSKRASIHSLFITFLCDEKFEEAAGALDVEVVVDWFEMAVNHCRLATSQQRYSSPDQMPDIPQIYSCLCDVLSVPCLKQKEHMKDLLDDVMLKKVMRGRDPKHILRTSADIDQLVKDKTMAGELFASHMKKLLPTATKSKKQDEILLALCGSLKKLRVHSRYTASIVSTILDVYRLQEGTSTEELFLSMVENQKFWNLLFEVEGDMAFAVKDHPSYKEAEKVIKDIADAVSDNTISCSYLETLNQFGFQIVKELFTCIKHRSITKIEKQWSSSVSIINQEKENLTVVETVLDNIETALNPDLLPPVFIDAQEFVKGLKNHVQCGRVVVKDLFENKLWNRFQEFPTLCKQLELPSKSEVFWNVCLQEVFENLEAASSDEELDDTDDLEKSPEEFMSSMFDGMDDTSHDEKNVDVGPTKKLLRKLIEIGCPRYREAWEAIQVEDALATKVKTMFLTFSSVASEVELAEQYCRVSFRKPCRDTLIKLQEFQKYAYKVKAMKASLKAFGIDARLDKHFMSAIQAYEKLVKDDFEEQTLLEVGTNLNTVCIVAEDLEKVPESVDILNELGSSQTLIEFLKDILDDDIRNLIDAVEEVSEQYVSESTVSGLIDVKRFLQPLLRHNFGKSATSFFASLAKQTKEHKAKGIDGKIRDCMDNLHNLKSLYNNVANRGQRTKEIIEKVLQKGTFNFKMLKGQGCDFKVAYKQGKKVVQHSKETLVDLRSRALLIMNTDKKTLAEEVMKRKESLEDFVKYVELALEIAEASTNLQLSGHFEYEQWHKKEKPAKLLSLKTYINLEYENWTSKLCACRRDHPIMSYIYGSQIQALHRFLEHGSERAKVEVLLTFIHPQMTAVDLQSKYKALFLSGVDKHLKNLKKLALTLEFASENLPSFERQSGIELPRRKLTEVVHDGKLFIVPLQDRSTEVITTLLALYHNTTQKLPEPSQLLFCNRSTTHDELNLLLQRCTGPQAGKNLFCIVNIELLPSKSQFYLVEQLRSVSKSDHYLLALISRGTPQFMHELSDNASNVRPLSDTEFRRMLESVCPDVCTVTSDVPGLGKTETVYKNANLERRQAVTFHISGIFNKKNLVERLATLNLRPFHVLHIDVGVVDNPSELDTFLFELIVLGFVSTGTASVILPTSVVYIEIANSINDTLRNSLRTATCFKRTHLVWQDYQSFTVSSEVNSSVQVVCQYLYRLETADIDQRDILLTGSNAATPLQADTCQQLLYKYFSDIGDMSFSTVNIFISVLADQLKKLSTSSFFHCANISAMMGKKQVHSVKSSLVKALIQASTEFASRSVNSCRSLQAAAAPSVDEVSGAEVTTASVGEASANRVAGMIRWDESNHLIYVFHNQDIQTVSVMYRDISRVPDHVRKLFESQMKRTLQDYRTLSQCQLQNTLQRIARMDPKPLPKEKLTNLAAGYSLTPDNLLKMVLIMLRIRAHVPVLVMGETGCGKTSLIRYLAEICQVSLNVVSIHAGFKEKDIVDKVMSMNAEACISLKKDVWIFLDEINTCDHVGLISDMVCHHKCLGNTLAPNLTIMAACNPYRLRPQSAIFTAGLQGKVKTDELSHLVYRVHPLPEAMVDYVWDFGSLSEKDEESYITCMVENVFREKKDCSLLAHLLVMSQQFVRSHEKMDYSTSLRDVNRCKELVKWFIGFLQKKLIQGSYTSTKKENIMPRAIILALAHCYQSRFSESVTREQYREKIAYGFSCHGFPFKEEEIANIIKEEQKDLLDRMELPPGTAQNTALRENVFVILVCILNKIPIFVVGAPGCSKSLSMQVIRSNLRGKDSKNVLFKTLPQLYCVSFQGSESSTSEGILKVFEKAERYQESNDPKEVLSVVILDEIGLAEISRFNPLKVLHSLLEPGNRTCPSVAVVGISNWALDPAKMNRAVHLSRPQMNVQELIETGESICDSLTPVEEDELFGSVTCTKPSQLIHKELERIAESYISYIETQRFKDFYGLRDFYSLVKYVARDLCSVHEMQLTIDRKLKAVMHGLHRNFGGLPSEMATLHQKFQGNLPNLKTTHISVLNLIAANVGDKTARHLMVITSGDAATEILQHHLSSLGRQIEFIFGSQFEEDQTDDYNYRILSKIILCMEQGLVLILKDLEYIYGSLYDMLNQNYMIVGRKKHCRVALGHYSNPMCHVHDDFRCIVLVEESKLDVQESAFLNRFEKQNLSFSDTLKEDQNIAVKHIADWVQDICTLPGRHFTPEDSIPIFSESMIPSLVLREVEKGKASDSDELVLISQQQLLWILMPEAIARVQLSVLGQNIVSSVQLKDVESLYFDLPVHYGLQVFLEKELRCEGSALTQSQMFIVFTHSNIHTNLHSLISDFKIHTEKLGAFKSEKQLSQRMHYFWFESDADILMMQCRPAVDEAHISLAKSVIQRARQQHTSEKASVKHVFLIMHLDRTKIGRVVPQMSYLSGWNLVTLDTLEPPQIPLPELRKSGLLDLIWRKRPLNSYIKKQMFWAFTRIGYNAQGRELERTNKLINQVNASEPFLQELDEAILTEIEKGHSQIDDENWQVKIACDSHALIMSSSLVEGLEKHVCHLIDVPLAKLIFEMEKANILEAFFVDDAFQNERRSAWLVMFHNPNLFSINATPEPTMTSTECYRCQDQLLQLRMPFFKVFFEKVEETHDQFMGLLNSVLIKTGTESADELPSVILDRIVSGHEGAVTESLAELEPFERWYEDYLHDFCIIVSASRCSNLTESQCADVLKWFIQQKTELPFRIPSVFVTKLHTTWWMHSELFLAELKLIDLCQVVWDDVVEESLLACLSSENSSALHGQAEGKDSNVDQKEVDEENKNVDQKESSKVQEAEIEEESRQPFDKESPQLHLDDFAPDVVDAVDRASDVIPSNEDNIETTKESVGSSVQETALQQEGELLDGHSRLVELVCRQLLPCTSVMTKFQNNIDTWQLKASNILALSAHISLEPSILHSLRFCSDIASFILKHDVPGVNALKTVGNLLGEGKYELDSEAVSSAVLQILETFSFTLSSTEVTKLLSSYVSRCIGANPESQIVFWLFHLIGDQILPDIDIACLKSPIHHAFLLEADVEPDILVNVLSDPGTREDLNNCSSFHLALGACLQKCSRPDHLLSKFVVLVVDLIDQYFEQGFINETTMKAKTKMDAGLQRLMKADHILRTESGVLENIVAAGYMKCFMRTLAKSLEGSQVDLSAFTVTLQTVNALLASSEEQSQNSEAIKAFFVKCFGQGKSEQEIRKRSAKLENCMPVLKAICWQEADYVLPLQGNLLALQIPELVPHILSTMAVLQNSEKAGLELIETLIKDAAKEPSRVMCLLYVAFSYYYLRSSFDVLADTALGIADTILKRAEQTLDVKIQNTLSCLLTRRNFKMEELLLSPESTEEQVMFSTVLVHMFSMLTAFGEDDTSSFFVKLFLKPGSVQELCLPGLCCESSYFPNNESKGRECYKVTTCLQQIISGQKVSGMSQCPMCHNNINHQVVTVPHEDQSSAVRSLCCSITQEYCEHISKVAMVVLHLLLYGCLIGSVALGHANPEDLEYFVTRMEMIQPSEEETKGNHGLQEMNVLSKNFNKHWTVLMNLLGFNSYYLSTFLQIVMIKTRDLLCKDGRQMSCISEKNAWERDFSEIIDSLIPERLGIVREAIRSATEECGHPCNGFLNHLYELTPTKVDDSVGVIQCLPEMLRMTVSASLEGLKSELDLQKGEMEFPVLYMVVNNLEYLELVHLIEPILQWNLTCVTYAHYRNKQECATVADFLYKGGTLNHKDMKKKFEAFQDAWNTLKRHNEVLRKFDKSCPNLQRMHQQCKLVDCIVSGGEETPIVLLLKTLAKMQNWFLDKAMKAAISTKSVALSFLQKDCDTAAVPVVCLQDVKPKELIHFEWNDEILKYSQSDLKYGCGRKILYDFQKIEVQLALEILMNKVHLTIETPLTKVVFRDEMFQNIAIVIQELKQSIPQVRLPAEVQNEVVKMTETNPKQIMELLTHLGVILALLKRSTDGPETLLVDCLDQWNSILTCPFPLNLLPSSGVGIKLGHIVALHELLEELNAEAMMESLEDRYRSELDLHLKASLVNVFRKDIKIAELALKATKRFIHRCLSSREADVNRSLQSYLSDISFWPDDCVKNGCIVSIGAQPLSIEEMFPADLLVQHVYKTVEAISKKIEEVHQQECQVSSLMMSFQEQPRATGTKVTRSRVARKYNKY